MKNKNYPELNANFKSLGWGDKPGSKQEKQNQIHAYILNKKLQKQEGKRDHFKITSKKRQPKKE